MWITEKFSFTKFRFTDTICRMVADIFRDQLCDGLLLVDFSPLAARGAI